MLTLNDHVRYTCAPVSNDEIFLNVTAADKQRYSALDSCCCMVN